jgi:hypothetical protein
MLYQYAVSQTFAIAQSTAVQFGAHHCAAILMRNDDRYSDDEGRSRYKLYTWCALTSRSYHVVLAHGLHACMHGRSNLQSKPQLVTVCPWHATSPHMHLPYRGRTFYGQLGAHRSEEELASVAHPRSVCLGYSCYDVRTPLPPRKSRCCPTCLHKHEMHVTSVLHHVLYCVL